MLGFGSLTRTALKTATFRYGRWHPACNHVTFSTAPNISRRPTFETNP